MKKVFLIYFNEVEFKEKIQSLNEAGYKVDYHFSTEVEADFRGNLPGNEKLLTTLEKMK